jgi:sterol desaturase/sphingolipid hydroxylase (fatty acid hydroxylase superfamily)
MFDNELLERFSRIHPATPFVVWVPVVALMLRQSWSRHELPLAGIVALFGAGVLMWTLVEYLLHRWVFHWIKETPRAQRIHFLLHGVHHAYPNDKDRLVMPLLASVPVALIFFALFCFLVGTTRAEPLFAGLTAGYLCYDGTHYAVHHFKQRSGVGRWLKRHHMLHHHADHSGGFGVSSPLWDLVFDTMPSVKNLAKKA